MYYFVESHEGISRIVDSDEIPSFSNEFFYVSRGYNTEEELRKFEELNDESCKKCGSEIALRYIKPISIELKEKCLCFSCNHWDKIIPTLSDKKRFIIDGQCYHDGGKRENGKGFLGFGGNWFKIKRFDTGEITETNNLWTQGEISEHYRDVLKDNAEFLKR